MAEVVAMIQARMNSTRLPGKSLMDIGGKSALQWVIDAATAAMTVSQIMVLTPDLRIAEICRGATPVLGPEKNVLERFKMGAASSRADIIVRLTADCPFVDPAVIDECVERNACAVDEWPDGLDVQVFNAAWLPLGDREHIIPLHNDLPQLVCPAGMIRNVRVTLDTEADLERLRRMAKYLPKDRPPKWRETLATYYRKEVVGNHS